jgi:hypothetical protein
MSSADNAKKVAAEVTRVCGDNTLLALLLDGPGFGRVMVKRSNPHQPYVVWRWATLRTDGSPVGGASGAMLYSGDYFADPKAAEADLTTRGRTA